jgi:Flp pilus assembly protein TadD
VYGFRCEHAKAEGILQEALAAAPNDTTLILALRDTRVRHGTALVEDKKYDEAIALYERLAAANPADVALQMGLADAYFKRAQIQPADSLRKSDFRAAGAAYSKAGEIRSTDSDLPFNAGLSFMNADEPALAEAQWRRALKLKPDDVDILSSLGSTLADQKKFQDAITILHQAVVNDPKNKALHRQLGAVYTKAGNNAKGTEELMVFLALQNGQVVADAAAQAQKAPAGSPAAKTLASAGPPEQLNTWEAEREKYETWFYWTKKVAYHFKAGTLVVKSDWSAADTKTASGGTR